MHHWKTLRVILPETFSPQQVVDNIGERVRINASEAGEFVLSIRIDADDFHSEGTRQWSVSYLPGPPGAFPTPAWRVSPR